MEGIFLQVARKRVDLIRLIALMVALPLILLSRPPGVDNPLLDFWLENMGYILIFLGLGGRFWAYLHIGGRKSKALTTTGPYALCRHPLYFSSFLLVFGIGCLFENWILFLIALSVFLLFHGAAIRKEEIKLSALFGDSYDIYRRNTPKLFPTWKHLKKSKGPGNGVLIDSRLICTHLLESASFLLLIPVADLVELFHRTGILPNLLNFT